MVIPRKLILILTGIILSIFIPIQYYHGQKQLFPGTISWEWNNDSIQVNYALIENKIIPDWSSWKTDHDSIRVHFRVLPFSIHQKQSLWDSTQIRIVEGDIFYNPVVPHQETPLFQSSGLEYGGALTRGFSVGNNQSLGI
jgi:hypothetical protein